MSYKLPGYVAVCRRLREIERERHSLIGAKLRIERSLARQADQQDMAIVLLISRQDLTVDQLLSVLDTDRDITLEDIPV